MDQEMYNAFKEAAEANKYDGWTNFGKHDLNEYERGFNDGVDRVLRELKDVIT